jgi:hypothetical protein
MPDEAQLLTTLTTEHFGLAGARSQAAGESASRYQYTRREAGTQHPVLFPTGT